MRTNASKQVTVPIALIVFSLAACENPRTVGPSRASSQATLIHDTNVESGGHTSPASESAGMPDGIARVGGRFFQVRNGKATLLVQRQRFSEGCYFERDGRVIFRDGTAVRLAEREMVTFAGERLPVPPNLELPQALPKPARSAAHRAAR